MKIGFLNLLLASYEAHVNRMLGLEHYGQLYSQRHHVWDLTEYLVWLIGLEVSQLIRKVKHLHRVRHLVE